MSDSRAARSLRRGMTLTELLVVVAIIVILASLIVPMMQPVMRGQKVREASRQVNTYLSGAQARAAERGRPVGVWIERAAHDTVSPMNLWYTSYRLYQAEQPDPYTGDVIDARVVVQRNPASPNVWFAYFDPPGNVLPHCCESLLNPALPGLRKGDRIRFEANGPEFLITGMDREKLTFLVEPQYVINLRGVPYTPVLDRYAYTGPANAADLQVYQPGVPFEIIRQPVRTAVTPIELPRNTAIDLSLSGYQSVESPSLTRFRDGVFSTAFGVPNEFGENMLAPSLAVPQGVSPEYDIVIMFRPQGGIDRVHYIPHEESELAWSERPMSPISLFIVRDDQIARDVAKNLNIKGPHLANARGAMGEANLQDTDNMWLTVDTQSGRVQNSPNVNPFLQAGITLPLDPSFDVRPLVIVARQLADTGQDQGGR